MKNESWKKTTKRYIAFFDIMGFKDMVLKNSHDAIVKKLEKLKLVLKKLESMDGIDELKKLNLDTLQTKSITFSDSIILFSKEDKLNDAKKILIDAYIILNNAIRNKIAIKGALSYGEITVDFDNSLFFGQPLIDAFELHEELQMYSVILDHQFESKMNSFTYPLINQILTTYKVNLKSGKINHKIIRPQNDESINDRVKELELIYLQVSGKPRIYIDNTIEFLKSLIKDK